MADCDKRLLLSIAEHSSSLISFTGDFNCRTHFFLYPCFPCRGDRRHRLGSGRQSWFFLDVLPAGRARLAGSNPIGVMIAGDVNADNKIGMEDILHDLKRIVEE